ncbi:hypothetical protein ACFWBN_22225 [Streptomyces sp. NPDC059989]
MRPAPARRPAPGRVRRSKAPLLVTLLLLLAVLAIAVWWFA